MILRQDQPRSWEHRGFTLVELLVSIAVLGLLVSMLAQVVVMTGQAISVNAKKLDAAGQARLVFDRLAIDLAAAPVRSDLKMVFTKSSGNDSLQFYSQINGYTQTTSPTSVRGLTAVGYQIPANALVTGGPVYQLERGATGTDWLTGSGDSSVNFYTSPAPNNADYDVLANGVFRLEITYLLNTGAFSNTNGGANASDYSHVKAIVVGLGVLDTASRAILANATNTQMQALTNALQDTADGQDPLTEWTANMAQPTFANGVPPQAVQGVRIYQRTFDVP